MDRVKKAEDASKSFLLLPSASALKSILTEVCACTQWMVLRQGSQGVKTGGLAMKKTKNRKTAPL